LKAQYIERAKKIICLIFKLLKIDESNSSQTRNTSQTETILKKFLVVQNLKIVERSGA